MLLSFFITANLLFGLAWCFALSLEGTATVGTPSTIAWAAGLLFTAEFTITAHYDSNSILAPTNLQSSGTGSDGTVQFSWPKAGTYLVEATSESANNQTVLASLQVTVSSGTSTTSHTSTIRTDPTQTSSFTSQTKTTSSTDTITSGQTTSTSSSSQVTGVTSTFNSTGAPSIPLGSTAMSGTPAMSGTSAISGTSASVAVMQSTSPASHTTHSTSKVALIAVVVVLIIAIMIIGAFLLVRRRRRRSILLKLDSSPSIPSATSAAPEMSSDPPSQSITPFMTLAPTSNSPSHSPAPDSSSLTSPDNTNHEPNSDLKIEAMSFLSTDPGRISTRDVDTGAPGDVGSTRWRETTTSTWGPMSDSSHYDPPPTYRSRPESQF